MTELEVATNVIIVYLSKSLTPESLYDVYEIKNGNKKILKEHIAALKSIFSVALKQLKEDKKS